MKGTVILIIISVLGTTTKGLALGRGSANYSIIKIDQNSVKSPGDLRSLTVTQTSVENHQLTLV